MYPEGTPTTQLTMSYFDLSQIEGHLLKSHMFIAKSPEELVESIKKCRFLQLIRSEKADLRLREIDRMLDFPNNKLRKVCLANFRQMEKTDEQTVFAYEYLFKQNVFLDKYRAIARNELVEDTQHFYKRMSRELKELGIKK